MPCLLRPSSLAGAAALLVASACAPMDPPPSSAPLAERCSAMRSPAVLPQPGELVDAEALRTGARRRWAAAGRPAGHVVFSVRHTPDGAQVRRAVIETTVPAALADSLQALVFAHRRQAPPAAEEWGARLRMDLGDEVGLRMGRGEQCAPRPRSEERVATNPYDVRERGTGSAAARPSTDPGLVRVRVRVDPSGRVTHVDVERSARRGAWEQRLVSYLRTMAFHPATEDGYPVPGETTITVRPSTLF